MELSIIIPSRKEEFLSKTIENILENIEADTEIIALLDGEWADPPIPQNERVNVIYVGKPLGQRGAANAAVRLAKGKYIFKCDAHCAFDKGFDRKMLDGFKLMGDNCTIVPIMHNLHAFNWKCRRCGWKQYQGRTPERCPQCRDSRYITKKMIWRARKTHCTSYCFDSEPHFQYFSEYKERPEYKKQLKSGLTETMSLQGSAFMCSKEKWREWDIGGEELGNWGNQGIQVACATWLSGGRVLVNHNTWYAHMFRTQGGDFSFPWPNSGRETQKTKNNVKDLFWNFKHPKQIYPVSWLVRKFMPVADWNEEKIKAIETGLNCPPVL
jgi:glycosyltransferase involved in cell wall biosynthesis